MNRLKKSLAVIFTSFILGGGLAAIAQLNPGPMPMASPTASPTVTPTLSPTDSPTEAAGVGASLTVLRETVLLNFFHHMNSAEVIEANEALQRSDNQQVRSFAQTLITDHQQLEQQVVQLANQKGLNLYVYQPSTVESATQAQLNTLSGSTFDLAYLQVQQLEHQKALQDLTLMQSQVTDASLQNLINQSIPIIQRHIDMAASIIGGLAPGGTASPVPSVSPQVG